MKQLLETYSIQEIIIFIILLAVAIKGVITWIDWAKGKIMEKMGKKKEEETLKQDINELKETVDKILDKITQIDDTIDLLVASDKDDIKAYITREHHYFCYKLGFIDDYNLDCIEKRYSHYKDEGGNSFVEDLMREIRALPKKTIEVTSYEAKK